MLARGEREKGILRRFESDTAGHLTKVIKDDGLYRHLRFMSPHTSAYYYDLVTWPGYLAIVGDAGDFMFARDSDMFEFFSAGGSINPDYWSEKLQGAGKADVERYSPARFVERVKAEVRDWCERWLDYEDIYPQLLADAVGRRIVSFHAANEEEASAVLDELDEELNEALGHRPQRLHFGDAWEWDLKEYTDRFIWCLFAIVKGIQRYEAAA